jgi:hypothetical protein
MQGKTYRQQTKERAFDRHRHMEDFQPFPNRPPLMKCAVPSIAKTIE